MGDYSKPRDDMRLAMNLLAARRPSAQRLPSTAATAGARRHRQSIRRLSDHAEDGGRGLRCLFVDVCRHFRSIGCDRAAFWVSEPFPSVIEHEVVTFSQVLNRPHPAMLDQNMRTRRRKATDWSSTC